MMKSGVRVIKYALVFLLSFPSARLLTPPPYSFLYAPSPTCFLSPEKEGGAGGVGCIIGLLIAHRGKMLITLSA